MITIETDKGTNEIAIILKFAKKEHIDSLIQGNINVEKIQYYVNLEKKLNIVGVGDKLDGATVIQDITLTDVKRSDGKSLCEKQEKGIEMLKDFNKKGAIKISLQSHRLEDLETPIFCAMCINKDDLIKEGDNYVFQFTKEQIEMLKKDFSDYTHAFIIDAGIFAMRINDMAKEKGINCIMDKVKYYNPDINQGERIEDYNNSNIIFWKRDMFEYQKEFRVSFPDVKINNRIDLLNVGKFDEKDYLLLDKDIVLNEDFKLAYAKEFL